MSYRPSKLTAAVLAIQALLVLLPLAMILYGAFQDGSPTLGDTHWSADSMIQTYTNSYLVTPLRNSLLLAAVVTVLAELIGLGFAWAVTRTDVPGGRILGLMVTLPLFFSALTCALAWVVLAAPQVGLLNAAGKTFLGLDGNTLNIYSFWGVVFVMVTFYVPFSYLANSAALVNMDSSIEEAGHSLGAGPVRVATRITLRMCTPSIVGSSLLIFLFAVELFSIPVLIGRGFDFETLIYHVYYAIRGTPSRWNDAAAIGSVLLVIATLALVAQAWVVRRGKVYSSVSGRGWTSKRTSLGRTRFPVSACLWGYVFLGVILPIAAIAFASFLKFTTSNLQHMRFTTENYHVFGSDVVGHAIWNTLILSVSVPTVLVVIALAVAYVRRHGNRVSSGAVQYLSTIPMGVPGVVLGVGLLWLFVKVPWPIYGTLLAIFLGYLTKMMPQASNVVVPALSQVDASLEESARTLGAGPLYIMRRILAPLVMPGVISAWLIVFVLASRELNVSIMLFAPNSRVLEVVLWNTMESGGANVAYAIAMVQTVIIGLIAYFAQRRSTRGFLG